MLRPTHLSALVPERQRYTTVAATITSLYGNGTENNYLNGRQLFLEAHMTHGGPTFGKSPSSAFRQNDGWLLSEVATTNTLNAFQGLNPDHR